jgi:hypothetical protein
MESGTRMTWKHWALAAAGVFVLSIDGWGCAGKAASDPYPSATCEVWTSDGTEVTMDAWVSFDDRQGQRYSECQYYIGDQTWMGTTRQLIGEQTDCGMVRTDDHSLNPAILLVRNDTLYMASPTQPETELGPCR